MTFIDLFAGIGGFRIALEQCGHKCVYSCEKDPKTAKLYKLNHGENPLGDVTKINAQDLPDFDILTAGFPCQPFSSAGKKKGFEDTRGTLFFDILRILKEKKPAIVILENVKNLVIHDKGNTFKTIISCLQDLEYTVSFDILNAKDFGVPQNRERIIIVARKDGKVFDFKNLNFTPVHSMLAYLDKNKNFVYLDKKEYTLLEETKQQKSGLIFSGYLNKNPRKGVKNLNLNLSRVHKQPNRIYSANGTHPTLSSQETAGRYYILTEQGVRKLTIEECFRFMGFPEDFKKGTDTSLQYQVIGNSVCIPMIYEIVKLL